MRFMLLVIPKGYEKATADFVPPADLVAKMTKYNESLSKAGVLLGLEGLHPPAKGTRVKFTAGKSTATDGPFAEAKELVGGYWMIQVKSKEEAIAWAKRVPFDRLPRSGRAPEIELRQMFEITDFPDVPPEVAKMEETFKAGRGGNS